MLVPVQKTIRIRKYIKQEHETPKAILVSIRLEYPTSNNLWILAAEKTWCYLFLLFLLFVYSMYVNDSFGCAAFFCVSAPVKTQKCDFDYEFEWCCQAAAVACEIIATQDMAE